VLERLQILARAVHELEPRARERAHQGRRLAQCEWVDQQDVVARGELHQRQLRVIGLFPDELGIQCDQFGVESIKCGGEVGVRSNPASHRCGSSLQLIVSRQ
jgi:hypothetical protein